MNATLRSSLLASLTLAALVSGASLLEACSSGDVAVGSTDQALQKKKNGTPTGNGQTCSWDDVVSYDAATGATTTTPAPNGPFKVGDTFKSTDGCNDCSCAADGITCTLRACAPAPDGGGGSCTYGGKSYASGASFPSTDGCNTCSCGGDGMVACTEMGCAYSCPPEKGIDCMPVVPPERANLCSGPYHEWIAANCGITFSY